MNNISSEFNMCFNFMKEDAELKLVKNKQYDLNINYFNAMLNLPDDSPKKTIEGKSQSYEIDYLNAIEGNLKKYTSIIINRQINITDRNFNIISERLFEDYLNLFYVNNNLYIDKCFSLVDNLYKFYKTLYLETNSPTVRFYQGKFSGLLELYLQTRKRNIFDNIISTNKQVQTIIWIATIYGSYRLNNNIDKRTRDDLNKLQINDLIVISELNGYVVRISNLCEQIIRSSGKYYNMYLIFLNKIDEKMVSPDYPLINEFAKRSTHQSHYFWLSTSIKENEND